MIASLFIWLGMTTVGVGVTSNPDLKWGPAKADAAAKAWMKAFAPKVRPVKARRIPGKIATTRGVTMPREAGEPGGLHFTLTGLEIPKISAFSLFIERWLRAEMARGWITEGHFGPAGKNGARDAVFSRRIRQMKPWEMPGVAREVPCASLMARSETQACYFVQPREADGAAQLKLGPGEFLRIYPRAIVAVDKTPAGLTARTRALVIVKRADIERFMQGAPRFRVYAKQFAGVAPQEPVTVDTNKDGVMDAWRFEGGATFKVEASAQQPRKQ